MKIAILGKGGSGKSSVSWLLSEYLSRRPSAQVLAIDADHNMDLTSCLGLEEFPEEKYFFRAHGHTREILGLAAGEHWVQQFTREEGVNWPAHYAPADDFLAPYAVSVRPGLDLLNVGLGADEIMYAGKCAHGHCAPLKYYLPRLKLSQNAHVVLDSVAGADMVNYGLYFGFDAVLCVVEDYRNSLKIARQLHALLSEQGLPLYFVLNKYNDPSEEMREFETTFAKNIVGRIPLDSFVRRYDFAQLTPRTIQALEAIVSRLTLFTEEQKDQLTLLKAFDLKKHAQKI